MRITGVKIENFGRLSGEKFEFKDGLNCIIEKNGWGKTTLEAFIRIMYYGFDGEGKRKNIRENERTFYSPWSKGTYGGTVEFSVGDKSYILTRIFGKSEKDDTFELLDAVTGLKSEDYTAADIGLRIFGVDSDSFKSTSCIGHNGIKYSGVKSDVSSKVSALPQSEDIAGFDKLQDVVTDYLNRHSPRRATGLLGKQKAEIAGLERSVARKEALLERLGREKENLSRTVRETDKITEERASLDKEAGDLRSLKEKSLIKKNIEEKRNSFEGRKAEAERLLESLGGRVPEKEEISGAEECFSGLEKLTARAEAASGNIGSERLERLEIKYGENPPAMDEVDECLESVQIVQQLTGKTDILEGQIAGKTDELQTVKRESETARRAADADKRNRLKGATGLSAAGIVLLAAGAGLAGVWYFLVYSPAVLKAAELADTAKFDIKRDGLMTAVALILVIAGIILCIAGAVKRKRILGTGPAMDDGLYERRIEESIKSLRDEQERDREDIESRESALKAFLGRFDLSYYRAEAEAVLYAMKAEISEYRELREDNILKLREGDRLAAEIKETEGKLSGLLKRLGAEIAGDGTEENDTGKNTAGIRRRIGEIKNGIAAYEHSISEVNKAREEYEKAVSENPDLLDGELSGTEDIDGRLAEISAKTEMLMRSFDEKVQEKNLYHTNIRELEEEIGHIEDDEERLAGLKESYKADSDRYKLVEKTIGYLTEAKNRFIARYMEPIRCSFGKYYGIIKDGVDADEYLIDTGLNIRRRELGVYRSIETQSDGLGDLIGLCMKAALLDVMYKDEKPVVIMDDPFSNLDEENIKWGLAFLDKLAEDYQVIYLTCHPDRIKCIGE